MPVYQLGNGNDAFNSRYQPDWTNNSSVFGGNGNDTILASAITPSYTSRLFVDGGNGGDLIQLDAGNSVAFGGNGRDTLTARGGLGGMGPGNTLTGGLGRDTFVLASGSGNLVVTNDAAGDGIVSDGDTFKGPMDVITDYQRGEHIGLRQYDIRTDGPTATDVPVARVDSVMLGPDPYTGDYLRPVIDYGQYAVFHGTFAGGNTFTVGADGPDLFAVYNVSPGPADPIGRGSLVLLGVSDEQRLDQALSPATASGPGRGWDFSGQPGGASSGFSGEDQAAGPMPAVLDGPAGNLLAMGLIAT